jgi:hypothetical protein
MKGRKNSGIQNQIRNQSFDLGTREQNKSAEEEEEDFRGGNLLTLAAGRKEGEIGAGWGPGNGWRSLSSINAAGKRKWDAV